jgi:hypothetical protein
MRICKIDPGRLAVGVLAAALLAGTPPAHAQQGAGPQPPPAKPKDKEPTQGDKAPLEDLLAQALKDNPDIRVAEARVQKAEAELNRTRLQVMQKVAAFDAARKVARGKVALAEQELARLRQLKNSNLVSVADFRTAEQALIAAQADLETVEAEMPALLGKPPQKTLGERTLPVERDVLLGGLKSLYASQREQESATAFGVRALAEAYRHEAAASVAGSVAEKIRKALDKPLALDVKDRPLSDVLEAIQDKAGIIIRNPLLTRWKDANPKITLRLPEALPLRALLEAIEDEVPESPSIGGIRFVVRSYGLLVVPTNAIPPGAVLMSQVAPAATDRTNPPSEDVEGVVKAVDAKSGLVTISIGSDAGLTKGHTLEVFRLNPAKYLGTVRIIEVTPQQAVAQPGSRMSAPVQAGDKVSSRLLGPGK